MATLNDRVYIIVRAGMQNTITVEADADPELPHRLRFLMYALRNVPAGERMARALRHLEMACNVWEVWQGEPVDNEVERYVCEWGG